ncbi:MAG: hypothetical protein L3J43_09030 [Sulfurovum sp.]|nr:hypothetical protein [Sulfurovum sp.]
MKSLLIVAILATLSLMFFKYQKDENFRKLLISLATFGMIIALAITGNLMRSVIPLFIAHEILIVIAWGVLLIMYVFKGKYYWWWFLSPLFTIGLFFVLEFLGGSAHELV